MLIMTEERRGVESGKILIVRVAIGSDHAGFDLKQHVKRLLDELRVPYEDFGVFTPEPADYPDVAAPAARGVADGSFEMGILICGTGIGMSIAANKIPGVRAALVTDVETARLSREHNDANIMTIGGRTTPVDRARDIVRAFLQARFDGDGRHSRRVQKIAALDCREP
jgi:ribose 5-phosphate isomerase B